MSEGILKFTLPEEREEFNMASNAVDYMLALNEICEHFRRIDKYTDIEVVSIEDVRDKIHEIILDRGLDI